jgi:putative phosphoserine phosphatase/1-acylglycerol-3-phosphate O-acyltransferase
MSTLEELIDAVHAAPRGARIAACFDYDGTVISGYSAAAFYRHRLRHLEIGPSELVRTLLLARRGVSSDEEFGAFLEVSLGAWRGRREEEIAELAERLFRHDIASHLHLEAWRLAEAHHAMGHTIVLASSATRYQVEPMARELGADHVLCTQIEVRDGILTGHTVGPIRWGEGKAAAVRELARARRLTLSRSFAYSNGTEDLPFLESVGHPVAVEPEDGLKAEAERRGWPVLRCVPRGGTPGPKRVARTALFYYGMAASFGVGIGIGALAGSRRTMLDFTTGVGTEIGLALAGVQVDVLRGEEHLWSARPCVFVFNHQSKLDPIIIARLLREGVTGVAKKEVANVPGFGQLFRLAGVAFIDRGDSGQARRALEPVIARMREEGLSLAMAPEGTRSLTPRLGPFKRGAFHIAMQAGVPVVPIVIRNAGEVMWRGAQTLGSGRVEVVVLPPIDTSDWSRETVAAHTSRTRDQFLDVLTHWPDGSPAPAPRPRRTAPRPTSQPAGGAR